MKCDWIKFSARTAVGLRCRPVMSGADRQKKRCCVSPEHPSDVSGHKTASHTHTSKLLYCVFAFGCIVAVHLPQRCSCYSNAVHRLVGVTDSGDEETETVWKRQSALERSPLSAQQVQSSPRLFGVQILQDMGWFQVEKKEIKCPGHMHTPACSQYSTLNLQNINARKSF